MGLRELRNADLQVTTASGISERRSPFTLLRGHADELCVAALTAAALALRASQIHQSIVSDEVYTYQDVFRHSFGTVLTTVHVGGENSPPLYFLLAWVSAKLGDPTLWIRLPSIVLGTATVPIVYAIGREALSRSAAVVAAGTVALAPFTVFYGLEARPYATMMFFVECSTFALLRAVRTGSWPWWLAYTVSAAAAAYSHYTCVFVLAVQAGWGIWKCRDRWHAPVFANLAAALLYLPWLPHLRGKELAAIGNLYPLTAGRVLTDLLRPIPGHPSAPLRAIPTIGGLIAVGVGAIAGLIALIRRRRAAPASERRLCLMTMLTAATPVGLLLYSVAVTDVWLPRGLSASLPAAALLLGALLTALWRPLMVGAVAVLAVTLVAGTLRSLGPAYSRGPFRTIAAYLDRVASPKDPISLYTYIGAAPVTDQFHRPHLLLRKIATWHLAAPRSTGYLVLDPSIARDIPVHVPPRIQGFQLLSRRDYAGAFSTILLTYRRSVTHH